LAIACDSVKVLHVKPWEVIGEYSDASKAVTDLAFGQFAGKIIASSLDNVLRIYGA
jgi:hypothetical protein